MSSRPRVIRYSGALHVLVLSAATQLPGCASRDTPELQVLPTTVFYFDDGQPVYRYRFAEVPFKPYMQELRTPGGVNVALDAPADHLHHHGLMFAVKVDDVNFWEETAASGQQVQRGMHQPDGTTFVEQLDWISPDERLLLHEQRTVAAELISALGRPDVVVLTWKSRLAPPGATPAVLTGAHYHGLGLRFVRELDGTAEFLHAGAATGETFRGEERLTPADWCACRGRIGGHAITVAMFSDAAQVRAPATWFTMSSPFAYMSATLRLHEAPLNLTADAPLELRYGIALWDGQVDAARIADCYRRWLAALPPAAPRQDQEAR